MIRVVRNWLSSVSQRRSIPGGAAIYGRYVQFQEELPLLCQELKLGIQELTFLDYANLVSVWLERNA